MSHPRDGSPDDDRLTVDFSDEATPSDDRLTIELEKESEPDPLQPADSDGELVVDFNAPERDHPSAHGRGGLVIGSDQLDRPAPRRPITIGVERLSVTGDDDVVILRDVSVNAPQGSLTAIVGPTGAGKSTLLKAVAGVRPPRGGRILLHGHDLYRDYEALRTQIGYVPQDDIVHPQLTARQALGFGADLRLWRSLGEVDRTGRVETVLADLGLSEHADKRIDRLSGGQRKRVSTALELLTEPTLLLLDEPTSGLDPGFEQAVMDLLREMADRGRTVMVVTHSTASLDRCDQVVFLGTGGWVGFCGPAEESFEHFEVEDFPSVFRALDNPPPATAPTPDWDTSSPTGPVPSDVRSLPDRDEIRESLRTLVRRGTAILKADRRAGLVLAAAAAIPAALLTLMVGGGALDSNDQNAVEGARKLLSGLIVIVGVLGAANGVREIVKEQSIYQRERGTGLPRIAYLLSKITTVGAVTAAQIVLVVVVVTATAGGPAGGSLLPGRIELLVVALLTGLVTLLAGLTISALVTSSERAMALIPVIFIVLWLFSGAVSDLSSKPGLQQAAYLSPSSWGMAAAASTADLHEIESCGGQPPAPEVCDSRWRNGAGNWIVDVAALLVLGAGFVLAADWALARKEPVPELRRTHLVGIALDAIQSRR